MLLQTPYIIGFLFLYDNTFLPVSIPLAMIV